MNEEFFFNNCIDSTTIKKTTLELTVVMFPAAKHH